MAGSLISELGFDSEKLRRYILARNFTCSKNCVEQSGFLGYFLEHGTVNTGMI